MKRLATEPHTSSRVAEGCTIGRAESSTDGVPSTTTAPTKPSASDTLWGMADSNSDAFTDADILKIARLSRLHVAEREVATVRGQLSSIIGHIAKLQALPTDGVEPMAYPMRIVNRLAADEPKSCMPVDEFLRNAPAVEGRYLAVPKVLGEGGGA